MTFDQCPSEEFKDELVVQDSSDLQMLIQLVVAIDNRLRFYQQLYVQPVTARAKDYVPIYISEFIPPSSSLLGAFFFFVVKKDKTMYPLFVKTEN